MIKYKWFAVLAMIALMIGVFPMSGNVARADDSRFFPETGHSVHGLLLAYWDAHGGLAQQGYPISDELQEQSDTDGKVYTMQYFQRAVFEMHPENPPPFNVLLSLLGVFYYDEKYGGNAPNQHTSTGNPRLFPETSKTIGGAFRAYWETHGGLAQQGYPISDEFQEVSQTDGKIYTVQYFQRAVFEEHPEFAGTPNEVLLSLLGVFYYNKRHSGPQPTPPPGASPFPTTPPAPAATATATATPSPVEPTGQILFFNGGSGALQPALLDQQGTVFNQKASALEHGGWTDAVPLSNGYILFYGIGGGGRTGKMDSDGTYQNLKVGIPFSGGWDQITSIGNMLVFFNPSTKKLAVGQVNADGSYVDLKSTTLSLAWQHMLAVGSSDLYFYLDDPVDPFEHKMIAHVDADGTFTVLQSYTERPRAGVPRGGWRINLIDTNHLFRYNSTSGQYYIEDVAPDGTVTTSPQQTLDPGWNNFVFVAPGRVLGAHGVFLAYRQDTGAAIAKAFDLTTYVFSDLKSYQGSTAFAPGWTHLLIR